jgi:acetyltransferase-like isoleucine patch superfamily enzyme
MMHKGMFIQLRDLVILIFFSATKPFRNFYIMLKFSAIIHPFAMIIGDVRLERGSVVGKSLLRTYGEGKISIGARSIIHEGCEIYAHGDSTVSVGEDCLLGKRTIIMTLNHNFADPTRKIRDQGVTTADVVVGNDVWTGIDVKILPGSIIRDGCVVGAGAIVTREIEAMSIVVGIPAKVIKKRV